jgi:hypothetical protein
MLLGKHTEQNAPENIPDGGRWILVRRAINPTAQAGLRDAKPRGGTCEVFSFHNGHEVSQVPEFHGRLLMARMTG